MEALPGGRHLANMKYRLIRTFFIRNPQPLISASKICHKMGFFGQFWTKIPLFGVETLCTYTLDYSLKKNLASVVPNPFSFFYLKFRQWRTKHCRLFRLGSLKFPTYTRGGLIFGRGTIFGRRLIFGSKFVLVSSILF